MTIVKVGVLEIDGVELVYPEERVLDSADCLFTPGTSTLTSANSADALRELSARHVAFHASASDEFSTTNTNSAAPSVVSDTAITPEAGEYACFFSAVVSQSQNTGTVFIGAYAGGSLIADTLTPWPNTGSQTANMRKQWSSSAVVTLDGSTEIDLRVYVSGGTGRVFNRFVTLVRIK